MKRLFTYIINKIEIIYILIFILFISSCSSVKIKQNLTPKILQANIERYSQERLKKIYIVYEIKGIIKLHVSDNLNNHIEGLYFKSHYKDLSYKRDTSIFSGDIFIPISKEKDLYQEKNMIIHYSIPINPDEEGHKHIRRAYEIDLNINSKQAYNITNELEHRYATSVYNFKLNPSKINFELIYDKEEIYIKPDFKKGIKIKITVETNFYKLSQLKKRKINYRRIEEEYNKEKEEMKKIKNYSNKKFKQIFVKKAKRYLDFVHKSDKLNYELKYNTSSSKMKEKLEDFTELSKRVLNYFDIYMKLRQIFLQRCTILEFEDFYKRNNLIELLK